MIWLKSKLEQSLDGADPRVVFARQGHEVQKTKTIVERAELAKKSWARQKLEKTD